MVVSNPEAAASLRRIFEEAPTPAGPRCLPRSFVCASRWPPELRVGSSALEETAAEADSDCAVAAVVGFAGLRPVLRALKSGKDVALANKEALVAAGPLVRNLFRRGRSLAGDSPSESRFFARLWEKARRSWGGGGLAENKTSQQRPRGLGRLLPVDSEHSAIFQCLQGAPPSAFPVSKLILCASGGPFFGKKKSHLEAVGVQEALKHVRCRQGEGVV